MAKKTDPAKSTAAEPQPSVDASRYATKIEAIKDIIFGEDYAALRAAIQELNEKVDRENARLDEKFSALAADLDQTINNRIDNLEMDLKAEIDRLDHHKTDRFKLGKMLEDIGKSLQE